MKRLFALAAVCIVLGTGQAGAHPPLPESVYNPRTAPEAWNVIRLATSNIEQLLRENRLAEIPDQASLCSPSLRVLARLAPPAEHKTVAEETVSSSVEVNSLAQAAMAGDSAFAKTTFESLRATLHGMESSFPPATVHADIYFCPMHTDVSSTDPAALCPKCGMSLVRRRIPYSFIYVPPGETSIQLKAATDKPLVMGQEAHVKVFLSKRGDGSPVLLSDLMVTHTQPVHLLIVDPALEDYHHEHPARTAIPGEYDFSFTPAKSTGYRIFADLVPAATGVQEYATGDLPGETKNVPAPHGDSTFVSERGGLNFELSFEGGEGVPLRARQARNLRVTIREPDGKPMDRLQPVMNAFAHLVGFYDDYQTVVHLHPAGPEVVNQDFRGGPVLDFRFYPPKPGFLRLYCQVVVDNRTIFAPFNVQVAP